MKIGFFEIQGGEAEFFKSKISGHELVFNSSIISQDSLPETKDFDAISVFIGSPIGKEVLAALPNLKFIATRTTGYDHIDLDALREKNILLSFVPSYGDHTVAEFAFGLLLCLTRKIFMAYDRIREQGSFDLAGLRGTDLVGKTLGIVGVGRIGSQMARLAAAFGMNILAYDVNSRPELVEKYGVKYVDFDYLLRNSDVISLHLPGGPKTYHIINKDNIGLIKRGCILINTARGSLVETDALIKALESGILAGAGLDVLEEEAPMKNEKEFALFSRPEDHNLKTIIQNHVLIDMDNVIITPHNAFNAREAVERILETTAGNINAFLAGNPVNLAK